jgi:malonyl-CoA/methylmalonyl-CoA synthetase
MNLFDLFQIPLRRTPDKTALEFRAADGASRTWTYAELFETIDRLAVAFQALGLEKGDRVAFFAGNSPEFVLAYLAVARLGAVMVPINLRYRRLELEHILSDATPRMLLTERPLLPLLRELGDVAGQIEVTVLLEGIEALYGDPARLRLPVVEGDDLVFLMYTSGTTGRSKGAMMSHNAIMATMTALLAAWDWQADDRLLLVLPLFHTHGLVNGLHCALAAGATLLLRPQYEAGRTADELIGGAATVFFAVPTIYVRLVEELRGRSEAERAALAQMRLFCSGSAPLAPETFHAFRDLTGHTILERYGMTETGMNLSNPYAGPRVAGSVGTPLPGVSMRIVKVTGEGGPLEDVAPGEEGELLVRGANLFGGYWNAPEKTAASFSTDAQGRRWFHTGDLARQDPESGYVTLLGRRHELIISGGFNIYPREIEELLTTYPGVREAAVIGMPHAEWGEVPAAYLVCEGTLDEQALVAWCRAQLAGFKVPKAVHVVESLPRNAMGKVQKNLLGK